jgi:hypothetical protein
MVVPFSMLEEQWISQDLSSREIQQKQVSATISLDMVAMLPARMLGTHSTVLAAMPEMNLTVIPRLVSVHLHLKS